MATAEAHDTPMGDADDGATAAPAAAMPVFSADELRMLALYDRLREQQLQMALLEAQSAGTAAPDSVETAQAALLDARAAYVLRNEAVDAVLTVNPVLKAVHGAVQASPVERDLLPAVEQRDAAAQTAARLASAQRAVADEHAAAAAQVQQARRANAALAAQVRALVAATVEKNAAADAAAAGDGSDDAELARLEAQVKASRQRWQLIKGTASAIVAGSGVDWARDAALREMVLDPE